ncbi:hypothetical protein MUK42_16719 [Musa troglodytarum]|uniref:Uncharacterized protein n=1 Tax=Musa troglodytarum TaxID=320322 RepID=A0A9E7L0B4_9LILI|nr:hypothetical protein MUK42_16719 [Musa troglodytarum]
METSSPPSSSLSPNLHEISSSDGLPIQQSLLLSESLKILTVFCIKYDIASILVSGFQGLRNMRSQLYSAAAYFELSYINDDQKEILVTTLKDYAVKAILNAVDHLGSVSSKVNSVVSGEVDEVSVAESEVSCIEQRLRTWQASIDHEGLSQQALSLRAPKYHERYILPGKLTAPICNDALIILDIAWIGSPIILHFLLFLP